MNAMRLMAVAVVALGFVAGARAADTNKEKIIATWEVVKADEGSLPVGTVVTFAKDDKFKITRKGKDDKETTTEGTYAIDGDKVTITMKIEDKEQKVVITIKKLTDTEMVSVNDKGKMAEYKKK